MILRTMRLILGLVIVAAVAGCARNLDEKPIARGDPTPYAEAARAYSDRVARFDRLWARSIVRLNYKDEKGASHSEQGEGVLQVVRPDHLALSIKKAGKMLFWLGCDQQRYWWLDVIDERIAQVGRHDLIVQSAQRSGAVVIRPLEVVRVLGILPLDPAAAGATQWSANGRLLGITTPLATGLQRVWVDPKNYEARKIELYDIDRRLVLVADLDQYTAVDITGMGAEKPRLAGAIIAYHPATDTVLKLDLAGAKDQGVTDKAFDFDELVRSLGVQRTIDLDSAEAPRTDAR